MGKTHFDQISGINGLFVGKAGAEVQAIGPTGQLYQSGAAITSAAAELNILDGVTATAAEINLIDGSVAGTAVASKALSLGANKNVDVLAVLDLKLGAGAGTSVTSTAAELNLLDGVTATMAELNLAAAGLTAGKFIVGEKFVVSYPQVAAADVAKTFFVAPAACKIVSGYERHVTVAGQAGVLTVEKLTAAEAPGAGDDLFTTGWDLTSTANTSVSKTAVTTAAGTLAAGDALCLKVQSGDAASYALGTLTIVMQWV